MEFWAHCWGQAEWLTRYNYGIILLVTIFSFLEVIIPFIPGYTVLLLGSSMAAAAGVGPAWLILCSSFGTWVASLIYYNVGSRLGERLLKMARFGRLLDSRMFLKIKEWFGRYGDWVLLISRLLPFARSGIILTAGIVKYEKRRALSAVALSILLTSTLFVTVGYWFGRRWGELYLLWKPAYNLFLLIAVGVIGVVWGFCRWRRKKAC